MEKIVASFYLPLMFSKHRKRIVTGEDPTKKSGLTYSLVPDEKANRREYVKFCQQIFSSPGTLIVLGIVPGGTPVILDVIRSKEDMRADFIKPKRKKNDETISRYQWLLQQEHTQIRLQSARIEA